MEFKKSYIFRDCLTFIVLLSIPLALDIAMLIFMMVNISNDKFSGVIIGIIFVGICAVGLLVIILILCMDVVIDEEKIEVKRFKRTLIRFYIEDIYKIEKKIGSKGVPLFIIYGNTPQPHSRKSKVNTINLGADEKREKILRHFITNPDVWETVS
ncbi:MAG: hypothetical protein K2N14_04040 [Clostridia bacterium]|nr:hypothetical protein [Clostridia bacterium]